MSEKDSLREVIRSGYWREDDAREVVAAWRRSGASLAEFCRTQGVAAARVSRWASRLESEPGAATFHPVRARGVADGSTSTLVVELPGLATIRLPPGFAVEDLRRILSAFESAPGC